MRHSKSAGKGQRSNTACQQSAVAELPGRLLAAVLQLARSCSQDTTLCQWCSRSVFASMSLTPPLASVTHCSTGPPICAPRQQRCWTAPRCPRLCTRAPAQWQSSLSAQQSKQRPAQARAEARPRRRQPSKQSRERRTHRIGVRAKGKLRRAGAVAHLCHAGRAERAGPTLLRRVVLTDCGWLRLPLLGLRGPCPHQPPPRTYPPHLRVPEYGAASQALARARSAAYLRCGACCESAQQSALELQCSPDSRQATSSKVSALAVPGLWLSCW